MKLLFSSLLTCLVFLTFAQAPLSNQVTVRNQGNVDNYTGVKQVLISVPADAVNRIYNGSTLIFNDTTGVFEIDTLPASSGGGVLPYYELVFTASTDGTTLMNYHELINTFPDTWTPEALASGGIILTYDDAGLDLYTIAADLYSPTSCTYNLVESQSICTTGANVQDTHQIVWNLLKSSGAGDVIGGASDLEAALLTNPLQIMLRWYY